MHGKVAGQTSGIGHNGIYPAGGMNAEDQDNKESYGHDNTLNEVSQGSGQETAGHGIGDDDGCGDDHGNVVVCSKQGSKQFAAGGKA